MRVATLVFVAKLVPYSVLMEGLDVPTVRELEDILIETIYSVSVSLSSLCERATWNVSDSEWFVCAVKGLLQGKLDQKSQSFVVKYAVGRDTQNEDIDSMIAKLTSWYEMSSWCSLAFGVSDKSCLSSCLL